MAKPEFDPNKPFDKIQDEKPEFDPSKPFTKEDSEGGLGSSALRVLGKVGRAIDSVTGAPMRSAIGAAQNADGITAIPGDAVKAGLHQFAADPDLAPSGKDIVQRAGVPDTEIPSISPVLALAKAMGHPVTYAGSAGMAMDLAANPLNFTGLTGSVASKIAEALPGSEAISDAAGSVGKAGGKIASKIASKITHKPAEAIKIYANRGGEVSDLLDQFGNEVPTAADAMKEKVLGSIKDTKKGLSDSITQTLNNSQKPVQSQPIIDSLQAAKAKINPHYNPGDISQIDEMIHAITANSQDGQMSLQGLFDAKNFLQSRSQGSFLKNGELFMTGDKASKAANDARKIATQTLHTEAPAIQHADAIYSDLHDIDDKISASLLGTGKAENIFASAGGGSGNVHQAMLNRIGQITGTNPIGDAQLIFAAKHFQPNASATLTGNLLRTGLDLGRGIKGGAKAAYSLLPDGSAALFSDTLKGLSEPTTAIDRKIAEKNKK